METVAVLGTGLVGNWIVRSLSSDGYKVIAIDADKSILSRLNDVADTIHGIVDEDLINSLDTDIFVNALPGRVGHRIRKILVEKGKKVADLAFTPEDPLEINQLAIDNDSILIYDVGVAPGLSNLLLKEANRDERKSKLITRVLEKKMSFQEALLHKDYYLTNLDLVVLCHISKRCSDYCRYSICIAEPKNRDDL